MNKKYFYPKIFFQFLFFTKKKFIHPLRYLFLFFQFFLLSFKEYRLSVSFLQSIYHNKCSFHIEATTFPEKKFQSEITFITLATLALSPLVHEYRALSCSPFTPRCLSLTMHLDAITDSMASNNAVTIKLKLSRPNGTECAFKHLRFTPSPRYFRSHYHVMKYRRHNCTPFALVFLTGYDRCASNFAACNYQKKTE